MNFHKNQYKLQDYHEIKANESKQMKVLSLS